MVLMSWRRLLRFPYDMQSPARKATRKILYCAEIAYRAPYFTQLDSLFPFLLAPLSGFHPSVTPWCGFSFERGRMS